MSTSVYVFVAALAVGSGVAIGVYGSHLESSKEISDLKFTQANELKAISDKAASDLSKAIASVNALQASISLLDNKITGELIDALQENENLRRSVASGDSRVQLDAKAVTNCKPDADSAGSTGSVGDANKVKLSSEAGSTVLDIRAGIISDQAKIDYLQGYIRELQKAGIVAGGNKQTLIPEK